MQQKFSLPLAVATGRSVSTCRLILRFLREAGLVPGAGVSPTARHIARIVIALTSDSASNCPKTVSQLSIQPLSSAADLPGIFEDALTRIVEALPQSPVVGDLDIDEGRLHIGDRWARIEALSLGGKRAVVTFGIRPNGICHETVIPISTVRTVVTAINGTNP